MPDGAWAKHLSELTPEKLAEAKAAVENELAQLKAAMETAAREAASELKKLDAAALGIWWSDSDESADEEGGPPPGGGAKPTAG